MLALGATGVGPMGTLLPVAGAASAIAPAWVLAELWLPAVDSPAALAPVGGVAGSARPAEVGMGMDTEQVQIKTALAGQSSVGLPAIVFIFKMLSNK